MNVHTRSVGGSLTEYHLVGTAERTIFPVRFSRRVRLAQCKRETVER